MATETVVDMQLWVEETYIFLKMLVIGATTENGSCVFLFVCFSNSAGKNVKFTCNPSIRHNCYQQSGITCFPALFSMTVCTRVYARDWRVAYIGVYIRNHTIHAMGKSAICT